MHFRGDMDEFSKATSQGYLYSDIPTMNFQVFPQRSILPPCMSPCMLALSLSPDLYSYPGYFLPFEKKEPQLQQCLQNIDL